MMAYPFKAMIAQDYTPGETEPQSFSAPDISLPNGRQ
jgi:hypothetical protein